MAADRRHLIVIGVAAGMFLLAAAGAQAAMQVLNEEELVGITAQDGVSFELDMRINSDASGTPDPTLCTGANRVQCRMAIKFANREDGGGEWLVWKGYSGRIYMPRFNMDATTSSASPSPYANTGPGGRFVNGFGVPVSPYNQPNIAIEYVDPIEIYNFRISGMAVEYGTGLTAGTGFQADPTDSRSFIGLVINNSIANQPATLQVDGQILVFGF